MTPDGWETALGVGLGCAIAILIGALATAHFIIIQAGAKVRPGWWK